MPGDFNQAMTIGIGLEDGHDLSWGNSTLDGAKVFRQAVEVDFSIRGANQVAFGADGELVKYGHDNNSSPCQRNLRNVAGKPHVTKGLLRFSYENVQLQTDWFSHI